ncbi:hypothetical protein HNO89_003626 [Sporosarcina luteola]|nr:hypothetical protein [Sporosarcina luteola]
MAKILQSKKILLASFLVFVSNMVMNAFLPQKNISFDLAELPDNHMIIEGYVVSKRIHSIQLAEEPASFIGMISGTIKGYGANSIQVSKNKDYEKFINVRQLKLNQKVRVYCDYVRESNPPKTVAFYIELIETND